MQWRSCVYPWIEITTITEGSSRKTIEAQIRSGSRCVQCPSLPNLCHVTGRGVEQQGHNNATKAGALLASILQTGWPTQPDYLRCRRRQNYHQKGCFETTYTGGGAAVSVLPWPMIICCLNHSIVRSKPSS